MAMLSRIIRKEVLEHLMSLRFAIACVLCFVVILSSVFVRYHDFSNALEDYDEDRSSDATALKNLSEPNGLVYGGLMVRQRPNPLKVFVRGLDGSYGAAVSVNARDPIRIESSGAVNPMTPLFPAMDFQYFVGIIMSLLAMVFAYDAVCGERERGTLRLMLSYSVPRDTVLLGKWIGGYVSLILPFLLAVVSGAAVVLVQSGSALSGADWLKLAAIIGLSLVYVAVMYSIALWVSTLTSNASTSIMVLVTVWMLLVLAVPNLSPYLAQAWRPARSPVDVETSRTQAADEITKRIVDDPMRAYDQEQGFGPRWWRNVDTSDAEMRARVRKRQELQREREIEAAGERLRADEKILQDLEGQLEEQVALSRWVSRVSPFSCFALASIELTDTGLLSKRHFTQQLRNYQAILSKYAFDEWKRFGDSWNNEPGQQRDWRKERASDVPQFVPTPPTGGAYARAVLADSGLLLGAALVFFMLSYLTFLRYDVR